MIIAIGGDEIALQIRKIADRYEVPIVESPLLARSLYHTGEIGQQIPEQLFVAVAQVLAYVYQLKQFKNGRGKRPEKLATNLPIPEDYKY